MKTLPASVKAALSRYINPHFPALRSGPLALSGASRRKQSPSSLPLLALAVSMAPVSAATLSFNINLIFGGTPSANELAAANAAKATWESIIVGYQIDDIHNTNVDVTVNTGLIDGVGGTIISAGPATAKLNTTQTADTTTFLYTQSGVMTLDSADSSLVSLALLSNMVTREMGRILGFGTLWSSSGVGIAGRQELYVNNSGQYTGAAGLAAYNAEFSQAGSFVPVELGGGFGFANAYWNEVDSGAGATGIISNVTGKDFSEELMTGWMGSDPFISSLTIKSMEDLGYVVVPEPTSSGLLGLSALVVLMRRKRSRA